LSRKDRRSISSRLSSSAFGASQFHLSIVGDQTCKRRRRNDDGRIDLMSEHGRAKITLRMPGKDARQKTQIIKARADFP
jgi:hypothetical protein